MLPNNGYLETCAAIGAGFFHQNMNLAMGDARYADELERVLFNGILSGVSLKGDSYFYENPLEADHKRSRWSWHSCPCCPPMFLKIMGALPGYIYAQDQNDLYVNQFIGSSATTKLNGTEVRLRQVTSYPWKGQIRIEVEPERAAEFGLCLRLPGWCGKPRLLVNGKPAKDFASVRGYARIYRQWQRGDFVELELPMPVERLQAHPSVEANRGRVAIQRGPLVYCLEAADNGGQVRNLAILADSALKAEHKPDFLGGMTVIRGTARVQKGWLENLYVPSENMAGGLTVNFIAIPYYANANRQPGNMTVWLPVTTFKKPR
jgi:DUF1680 family protein